MDRAVSSRTLRALAGAGEASRTLLTKAQGELAALGAYAASKAAADSRLLVSVGVVAAAELAAFLARPLLAAPSSSSPSSSGGSSSSSDDDGGGGLAPQQQQATALSLQEKVELVQSGTLGPLDLAALALQERGGGGATWWGVGGNGWMGAGRRRFAVPSFADAGDPDALLADMYARTRRARGLGGLLPALPRQLEALALPLRAVGALPSLPGAALRVLDMGKRLGVGAETRRPVTELWLQQAAMAKRPSVLPPLEEWVAGRERRRREDGLVRAGVRVGGGWAGLGVRLPERETQRGRRSGEQEEGIEMEVEGEEERKAVVLPQLGVLGAREGAAAAAAGMMVMAAAPAFASSSVAAVGAGVAPVWWGKEEEGEAEGAVPTVSVSKVHVVAVVCFWMKLVSMLRASKQPYLSVVSHTICPRPARTYAHAQMGKRRRSLPGREGGFTPKLAATALGGLLLWDEGDAAAVEEDARRGALLPVRRMVEGSSMDMDAETRSPRLGGVAAGAGAYDDDDDDVLDARAEAVSPEEARRAEGAGAKAGRLLLRGTLRALDVTLLGLEFLAVEALPAVAARAQAATRRAAEAVLPPGAAGVGVGGGRGKRDLLPVFERPMRSDLMNTRRR